MTKDKLQEAWEDSEEWYAVDLDGTLAEYDEWRGMEHIGAPVPKMLARVKRWLSEGKKVKILTARANTPEAIPYVERWLVEVAGLPKLEVTNVKGHNVKEIWDDKVRQVIPNTGVPVIPDEMAELLEKHHPSELSSEDEKSQDFTLFKQLEKEQS